MHTVVFGWFGASAVWFIALFWRLVKTALPGGAGLRGPGTIRLWLGFICVLVASCTLEASLVNVAGMDGFGHALATGFGKLLGHVATPLVMLALLVLSLPWLIDFRWSTVALWADGAFGLGLSRGLAKRDEDARRRSTADDALPAYASTPTNTMAPRNNGRYARPTVWRPPASKRASAAVTGATGAVVGMGETADAFGATSRRGAAGARTGSQSDANWQARNAASARGAANTAERAGRTQAGKPFQQTDTPPRGMTGHAAADRPAPWMPAEPVAPEGWLREPGASNRQAAAEQANAAARPAARPSPLGAAAVAAGVSAAAATTAAAAKSLAAGQAAAGSLHGAVTDASRAQPMPSATPKSVEPVRTNAAGSVARSVPSTASGATPRPGFEVTRAPQPAQSAPATQTRRSASGSGTRAPSYSRPPAPKHAVTPPASVQETLRNIEENAARWTSIAGASLARREGPEVVRYTTDPATSPVIGGKTSEATVASEPTVQLDGNAASLQTSGAQATAEDIAAANSLPKEQPANDGSSNTPLPHHENVVATPHVEAAVDATSAADSEVQAAALNATEPVEINAPATPAAISEALAETHASATRVEISAPATPAATSDAPGENQTATKPFERAAPAMPVARSDAQSETPVSTKHVEVATPTQPVADSRSQVKVSEAVEPSVTTAPVPPDVDSRAQVQASKETTPTTVATPAVNNPAQADAHVTTEPVEAETPPPSNVVRFPGFAASVAAPPVIAPATSSENAHRTLTESPIEHSTPAASHYATADDTGAEDVALDEYAATEEPLAPWSSEAREASGTLPTPEAQPPVPAPSSTHVAFPITRHEPANEPTSASANEPANEPVAPRPPVRGHAPTVFEFHAPAASMVELPTLDLLAPADPDAEPVSEERLIETGQLIEQRLQEFKVPVTVVGASAGPVITRFEVEPALGVRGSQIVGLMKDLSRGLGLTSIRVVETIPGKTCMGLELPNPKRQTIRLSEILEANVYQHSHSMLTLAMGKDITGHPVVADLAKAPHMLVAGTTGSGKSVAINAMIVSLLYKATPEDVRLIMIDPKMLELSVYEGIPHLLAPVVTDMKLAANALNWCVGEMEKRYKLMSAVGVRNLAGFNQKIRDADAAGKKLGNPFSLTPEAPEPLATLPLIVVVIDELADLMMVAGKKIEELIARLAQKARAAGIHLILATQRPSVDVITGLIKANIPTRVAFQVSSKIDSRTILDQMGAESLLGQGDMLFLPPGTGYPQRVHGAFVADEEVHRIVEYLKQFGEPQYEEGILDGPVSEGAAQDLFGDSPDAEADPLYDEAVAFVVRTRRASISSVQRQLRIGYNRAARLVEQMETAGLVSSMGINGSREVLAPGPAE